MTSKGLLGSSLFLVAPGQLMGRRSLPQGPPSSFELGDVLERFDLAVDRELLERVRLDLAHPLAREAELPPDRLQRGRVAVAVEPVSELDNLALAVGQLSDCAVQDLLLEADRDVLLRRRLLARDQVAEHALALVAERLVETRDRPRRLANLADLLHRQLRALRDLLLGG